MSVEGTGEFIKDFLNSINESAVVIDLDGNVLFANKHTAKRLNLSMNELIGRNVYKIIPKKLAISRKKLINKSIKTKKPVIFNDTRDDITFENHIYPIIKQGDVTSVGIIAIDVTTKLRTEAELITEKELIDAIFMNTQTGVAITSPKFYFININPAFSKIIGYSLDELKKLTFKNITHPDDINESISLVKKLIMGEIKNFAIEKRYIRKDKKVIYARVKVSAINNQAGNLEYYAISLDDITKQKIIQERLIEHEKKLNDLFEGMTDGILVADAKTKRFVFANKSISKITGYHLNELTKMNVSDLHPKKDLPRVIDSFDKLLTGDLRIASDIPVLTKDKKIIYCDISGRQSSFNGKPTAIGIFRDVTEIKKLRDDLDTNYNFVNQIIDKSPAPMWVSDSSGTIIRVNEALTKMLKLKSSQIIEHYNVLRDTQVKEQGILPLVKSVFEQGKTVNFIIDYKTIKEKQLAAKEPVHKIIEIHMSPIYDSNHNISGVICIENDITARLKAEEQLKDSEEKYRAIFDQSPLGVLHFDNNGVITACNESFVKIIGSSRDKLIGLNMLKLPDQKIRIAVKKAIDGQRGYYEGYYHSVTAKKITPVKAIFNSIKSSTNEFIGGLGIIENITERKHFEEELITKEARFRELFDNMSSGVAVYKPIQNNFDFDFVFADINQSGERISKIKKEEILGKRLTKLFPSVKKIGLLDALKRVSKTGKPERLPITKYKDKRITQWVENYIYKIPSGEIIAVYDDVTQSKITQDALIKSEEELSSFFDNARDMLCIADIKTATFAKVNPSFTKTLGYSEKELLGQSFIKFVHPDDRQKTINILKERLARGVYITDFVNRYKCKDGTYKWLDWTSKPVVEKGLTYATARDITERLKAEDEIKDLARFPRENPNPVIKVTNGIVSYANKAGCILLSEFKSIQGKRPPEELNKFVKLVLNSNLKHELEITIDGKTYLTVFVPFKKENYVNIYAIDITTKKEAEDKLKKSEEKYRNLVENTSDIVYSIDTKGVITYISANVSKYGLNAEELIGKSFTKIIYYKDIPKVTSDIIKTITTGELFSTIFRVKHNSDIYWFEEYGKPFKDTLGKIIGSQGVLRDITNRIKSEDVIKKSEEKYRSLFENANEGLLSIDLKGNITSVNPYILEMIGMPANKLVGKNVTSIVPRFGMKTSEIIQSLKKLIKNKKIEPAEWTLKNSKGERVTVSVNVWPIKRDNNIIGFTTSINDITNIKKAEEKLKTSEEEFRNIFNSSTDGIAVVDLKGHILKVNKQVLTLIGSDENELVGKNFISLKFISPKSIIELSASFARYLMHPELMGELIEAEAVNINNDKITIELRGSPFYKNNKLAGIVVIIRDITERKKLLKIESEAKLQKELETVRTNFVMMITHELKQPLTPIAGYASLLKDTVKTSEEEGYLDRIINNTYRMRDMINKILTLLKLEMGTLSFKFEKNDLLSVLEEVAVEKKSMIELKKLKLTKKVKSVNLKFDYDRIKEVISNLIDNAIKFTNENDTIEIKNWHDSNNAYVSIKDTGIGMKSDDVKKLFTKFYQTEEGRRAGGTGIGLAVSKNIIESHKGKIEVKSEYKKGSEFIISIPLRGL